MKMDFSLHALKEKVGKIRWHSSAQWVLASFCLASFPLNAQDLVGGQISQETMVEKNLYESPIVLNELNDPELPEVSGVAVSHRDGKYIWAINDGGHASKIYLLSQEGKRLTDLSLDSIGNYDWEDLESFQVDGKPYLLIADVGDNLQRRKVYYLHFVPEPTLTVDESGNYTASLDVSGIRTLGFQYEDGSRDCESVTVDAENGKVLLLSKRDKPARLYTLPLNVEPKKYLHKATLMTEVPKLSRASVSIKGSFLQRLYPNMPTAMSLRNQEVAILTYRSIHLYDYDSRVAPYLTKRETIDLPSMPQAEAMSFLPDGRLVVFSEKVGSPIVLIKRQNKVNRLLDRFQLSAHWSVGTH